MYKHQLSRKVWDKKRYYDLAGHGSFDIKHYGMRLLKKLAINSESILDLGCGEGTRLNYLTNKTKIGLGVDISGLALKIARKKHSHLRFLKADLEKLPIEDDKFDLVYSAYTLEHVDRPDKVINEAIRVTKPGGKLVFIAPNYGSPNRSSPVYKGSRVRKLVAGYIGDVYRLFKSSKRLVWEKVQPKTTDYFQDSDTVVEPYIASLIEYTKERGALLVNWSTCWEEEMPKVKLIQRLFRLLAKFGTYPFKYWGPHLVVCLKKPLKV